MSLWNFQLVFFPKVWDILCMFYFWYFFFSSILLWISCMVLFTVCGVLWTVLLSPHLLHIGGLVHFSRECQNLWHLWHLSKFGMYVSTLDIVYPILISVGVFRVLKLWIYIVIWIILPFFLKILWGSVIPCLPRLVFISFRVQREREIWTSHSAIWWVQGVVGIGSYSNIIKIFLSSRRSE